MDRGDTLSGAAFSAVLRSAVVFVVLLSAFGLATLRYFDRNLMGELSEDVRERWDIMAADYRNEGFAHVERLIANSQHLSTSGKRVIGLFNADGTWIAGTVLTPPRDMGLKRGTLDISSTDRPTDTSVGYLYMCAAIGNHLLVVGHRLDAVVRARYAVLRTLAITGFLVVLSMLAFGYVLSRRSLGKLQHIERVLESVSDGDIDARIAGSPDNDQVDRIGSRMNAHLDTLSRLMATTRGTAAAIAHDLKSPLARAYMGLGRALDRIEAGQDARAELADVEVEMEQMRRMFDTYLNLARIEAGANEAQFSKFDLGALLKELADSYQPVAEDAGQYLDCECPGGQEFTITGNEAMLQQLIVNLLENAITHGSEGNRIRLRLERRTGTVQLSVSDSGPGIPAAERAAVFEPFYRLDSSRSKSGSGLGLALVRAIAEQHGAKITLADNATGLRVEVVFPVVSA
ncbi:MAG: HAMP domain-containing histidine kinase [Halioglobus sp.]|nr:HAMP domain-containing histidine kinase [Halioglobus sp.]